ncbi:MULTISPECIES: alpha/beta fold hydrolase [Streptomyces]|uniref:alpha/beta fold hydrolase n=1 Tax=Streptomyces TaxID=1883 RepID=UPI0004AB80AA|nr:MULTISPECIES: alpha/beta hydrolase [Streptomyces]
MTTGSRRTVTHAVMHASDGTEIPYHLDGDGPETVVLLHGGYGSPEDWSDHASRLAAEGFRVVRPYLRGHHGSRLAPGTEVTVERTSQDMVELLNLLAVERAHFAGWSYGGAVVLDTARVAGDRIRSLALLNTFAAFRSQSPVRDLGLRLASTMAGQIFRLPRKLQARVVQRNMRTMVVNPARKTRPQLAEAFAESVRHNSLSPDISALMKAAYHFDARPWLATIRVPALVVTGTKDYIPAVLHRELAAALPEGHLDVLPGGRHTLLWDHADWLADHYLGFLRTGADPTPA